MCNKVKNVTGSFQKIKDLCHLNDSFSDCFQAAAVKIKEKSFTGNSITGFRLE